MSPEQKKHVGNLKDSGVGPRTVPGNHSAEEDLPPALKSVEAALASLTPRTEGVDRERLAFLAGRESAIAAAGRHPSWRGRWAWPGAFSAMTAVAASLAVMLLVRPGPQTIVRFVPAPVAPPPVEDGVGRPDAEPAPEEMQSDRPSPEPAAPGPDAARAPGRLAFAGPSWLGIGDSGRIRSAAPYTRLLEEVLADGPDSWNLPTPAQQVTQAKTSVTYREFLNHLLEEPTRDGPLPEQPPSDKLL